MNIRKLFFVVLVAIAFTVVTSMCGTTAAGQQGEAQASRSRVGRIVLYEGNGGSQDIVHTYTDARGQSKRVRPNDEARSLKLFNVRAGAVIVVYDNSDGKRNDDYCIIRVKRRQPEYTVTTFERSYSDVYVSVSYVRRDGLDGRVSYIRIR